MTRSILYIVVALCVVGAAVAQQVRGVITGTVKDAQTGQPLIGANVVVRGTFIGSATNAQGVFRLTNVPAGRHVLVISMVGYQRITTEPIQLRSGEEVTIPVRLQPIAIQTEQIVITASRREQSLQEVPVSVSTVTAKMIADRNTVTLDDALRYVPGVNFQQDQVNIRGSSGYSRGVGSRVLLLLDGLPFLTGDTGEINWETIPTHEVERIEVVKGAGSALYGSSALGGVINVITRDAHESSQLRIRIYSGLYDKPRFSEWDWSSKPRFNSGAIAGFSGRAGPLSYIVSVNRNVDESYRENDAYHRWSFFAKGKYDFSTFRSITVSGNYLHRSHGNFFWWESLQKATRPATPQRDGKVESRRGNLAVAFKEFVSDRFFYTIKGVYFGNFWRDDSSGRVNNVSTSHLFNIDLQGTYDVTQANILTFGIAANYDRVNANLFGSHPGVGAAAYIQDEMTPFANARLTAGLRLDWQKVSALPSTAQVNPKVGFVYAPDAETSLRASIGSGFRYPAIGEFYIESSTSVSQVRVLPNADLKVERSISIELGASRSIGGTVFIDLALFQSSFKNLIEPGVYIRRYRPYSSSPVEVEGPVIQFDNVTEARIQGGELTLKIDWWRKHVMTDLGYTYTWPRDLTENAALKFRPRHLLYLSGSLELGYLRASGDFRYISRIERIDENLVRLAPIIHGDRRVPVKVVDVRSSYDLVALGLPMRVGFNVNNLLNYHYVELIGNLAPPRTYFLSVEAVW